MPAVSSLGSVFELTVHCVVDKNKQHKKCYMNKIARSQVNLAEINNVCGILVMPTFGIYLLIICIQILVILPITVNCNRMV